MWFGTHPTTGITTLFTGAHGDHTTMTITTDTFHHGRAIITAATATPITTTITTTPTITTTVTAHTQPLFAPTTITGITKTLIQDPICEPKELRKAAENMPAILAGSRDVQTVI